MIMIYADDDIFIGPDQKQIFKCYNLLSNELIDKKGNMGGSFIH